MFSGGDSSGEFNNFRLASSGGSGGVITDWATLAQQWIAMRDSNAVTPAAHHIAMPDAPPPPNISGSYQGVARPSGGEQTGSMTATAPALKKSTFEEKGEADMDMDDDEDNHDKRQDTPPPPAPSMHISGNTKVQQTVMQSQWFVQPGQTQSTIAGLEMGNTNQQQQWNAWSPATRISLPPPAAVTPVLHTQPQQSHGHVLSVNPTSHIPSLMKINVTNPNAIKMATHESNVDDANASPNATMDAAKRKILPAWIREGLEKMEREKQKQMERQQQQPRSELNIEEGINEQLTVKNKSAKALESDSSGNDDDDDNDNSAANLNIDGERIVTATRLALSGNVSTDKIIDHTAATDHDNTDIEATEPIVGKNYEEKLADLMIIVRRTLTELLLEVTNDEIYNIAHETINLRKSKASSAQVIRKSALSSITGKLGLAAYDDSSSDAESSASENEKSSGNNSEDSEDEIRASIRVKRRTFAKVSEEIEERIAASAVREEQKLKYYTQIEQQQEHETSKKQVHQQPNYDKKRECQDHAHSSSSHHTRHESSSLSSVGGKGYERDIGETTESKLQHSNGKRQKERSTRKERTTRFSDNKDSRSASIATAASYISQMQSAATNSANSSNATASLFQMATSGVTDTAPTACYSRGLTSGSINKTLINAAEAAFEKTTKSSKSSSSSSAAKQHRDRDQRRRRHGGSRRHSSDDDSSSSDDDDVDDDESETSASTSSRNSKYSRTSSSRHKRSNRIDSRTHYRKHSTASSSRKSKRSPHDYDEDYYSSRHSRHSSKRSRSRSRSSYSSSSHRRRH